MDVAVENGVNTHATTHDASNFERIEEEIWDACVWIEEDLSRCRTLQEVKLGSVPGALRTIAAKFATGRLDLTASVLDAILLNTAYAFGAHSTITVGFRAESLAYDLGKSPRSIQEVLQDLERCGYLARGKGGEFNGLTGLRLTRLALRDPNTFWILKTKGRNVPGFVEWLTTQQLDGVTPSQAKKESLPVRVLAAKTPKPANRARNLASPLLSNDIKTTTSEEKRGRADSRPIAPLNKLTSASENSFSILLVQTVLREFELTGIVRPELLEEFDDQASLLNVSRKDLIDYVDFKVWELTAYRQESYTANTVVRILCSDLVHYKAVITNLVVLRRRRAEMEARSSSPTIELEVELEVSDQEPQESLEKLTPESLEPWQTELKSKVSSQTWMTSLSKLNRCDEAGSVDLWAPDAFVGTWTVDHFADAIVASVGPCRICWESEGQSSFVSLEATQAASEEVGEAFSIDEEGRIVSDEDLESWQIPLRDAVSGPIWRMFLRHLRWHSKTDEVVYLSCEDAFLAAWIAENYISEVVKQLGPVDILNQDSVWELR